MAKHTILILDDEKNILSALERLLRAEDRRILVAENAAEALEKIKQTQGADLVISDNRLPDMSGVEFLTKVRQSYPDTIRIMITGYPGLDSAIEAINKGQVYRYIPKPWENEELRLIVKQALDYCDVLRDNRALLRLARQQAEWLNTVKKQYPQISKTELTKGSVHIIDEKKVSQTLAEFLKRYYPRGI